MRSFCAARAFLTNCWVIVEAPCCGRAGEDVLVKRAGDALVVDAAVLVEAAVLDRDNRLLHHRGDLARLDEDPALVVGERGSRVPLRSTMIEFSARSNWARFSRAGRSPRPPS